MKARPEIFGNDSRTVSIFIFKSYALINTSIDALRKSKIIQYYYAVVGAIENYCETCELNPLSTQMTVITNNRQIRHMERE